MIRLKTFNPQSYKNLQPGISGFNFEKNEGYIALIGLNGSGKSNFLEAIARTFSCLLVSNTSDDGIPTNSSVMFEINGNTIHHSVKDKAISENELPSNLIACYSGEDTRLWVTCFQNYYINFFNNAIKGGDYIPKLLYINRYCWKIALIALLFSENDEVKHFLSNAIGIQVDKVTIHLKQREKSTWNIQEHDASNWLKSVIDNENEVTLSVEQFKTIDLNNTLHTELTDDAIIFYYLYFLSMPQKNISIGLNADKIIDSIDIKLGDIDFNDLSEGQKKMILVECITQILGDENSLVLLDEPDAHSHVAMKKDLLKIISSFKGQTIFTTHSPMFLNKRWKGYKENNIFYINDGKIESTEPLRHMTELTDNAVDYFEGAFILSSKYILVVEGPNDTRYLEKAIQVFTESDKKYGQLSKIAIIPAGSAGNTEEFYKLVLKESMPHIDRLVFLYDYDEGGYDGWKKTKDIDPKASSFFYQTDYTNHIHPTNKPDQKDTVLVEDFFSVDSYAKIVKKYKENNSFKDFRCYNTSTSKAIKTYIENNYENFAKDHREYYDGFRPVLDMLLKEFNLQKT